MSTTVLQINYNVGGSWADYEASNAVGAALIAGLPSLGWKIWLKNAATGEGGGIYLFRNEDAAQGFATQVAGMLKDLPQVTNVSIKQFGVIESLTAITRGPIETGDHPRTFSQMAAEAMAVLSSVTPLEAQARIAQDPEMLVVDVQDAADVAAAGTIPGAANISLGALTYKADRQVPEEWRDPRLADRARPIIITCFMGPLGAIGGKLLHDMGFTNVSILSGGVQAWIEAGLPIAKNGHR